MVRTKGGEAPGWQGATSENTGSILTRSNAARRDAAPAECSWSFTTGCYHRICHLDVAGSLREACAYFASGHQGGSMYRLVPPSRTPLALGIAVFAFTCAAAMPGSASTPAGQPATAHEGVADDPDVLGAERLFSAWMEGQIAYRGLPGIVVGVVSDQEVVWARGFGFADINAKLPMTATTKFRMASHSKLFTAIAIMQLREEGKVRLDDPVAK